MPENVCPNCGAKLAPGRSLCGGCERRLRRMLALTPRLIRMLRRMENPLRSPRLAPSGHPAPQGRAPLNLTPMMRADRLEAIVREYAAALDTTTGRLPTSPHVGTSSATSAYIKPIRRAYGSARALAYPQPAPRHWGPCPSCGTPLTAPTGATTITCGNCGSAFDPATLARRLTEIVGGTTIMTRPQLHRALRNAGTPVAESTLRGWIETGRLTQAGTLQGTPAYPLQTALALALSNHRGRPRKSTPGAFPNHKTILKGGTNGLQDT